MKLYLYKHKYTNNIVNKMIITTKICRKCCESKTFENFGKRSQTTYYSYCIPCKKLLASEYYKTKMGDSIKPKKIESMTNEQKEKIKEYYNAKITISSMSKLLKIPYSRLMNWKVEGLLEQFKPINVEEVKTSLL